MRRVVGSVDRGIVALGRRGRSRAFLLSAALVLIAGAGASAAWQHDTVSAQPDPVYLVSPGTVPVASPTWTQRSAAARVVVPSQAVGFFPYGTPRPGRGSQNFVQVAHLLPRQRPSNDAPVRSGRVSLRYRIEIRAVHVRDVAQGYVAVHELGPADLIVPRYIYSLGAGDIVSGQAPSMRDIEFPKQPPPHPVIVEYDGRRKLFTVTVDAPQPGWSGRVYPLNGGASTKLRPVDVQVEDLTGLGSAPAARLQATLRASSVGDLQPLLRFDSRPAINVGWVEARNRAGELALETPLRY